MGSYFFEGRKTMDSLKVINAGDLLSSMLSSCSVLSLIIGKLRRRR